MAEDFTQWVIEDRFTDGRPPLEKWRAIQRRSEAVGAGEVARTQRQPPHPAYPALLLGHHEVAEAMRDPEVPVYFTTTLNEMLARSLDHRIP